MSYTVNWVTKVISVPLTDLTLVSGSNYTLNAADFWIEVRRLEADPTQGLYAIQALEHVDTQVLSGITYVPIEKLINGYTWFINTTNINCSLIGPNSNLLDTFIPGNGVSVLANNSAGKQQVGSGLDAGQDASLNFIEAQLTSIENGWDHDELMRLLVASMAGKMSGPAPGNAGTVLIRDLLDGKNRISMPVDANGYRTGPATYDVTP